MRLTDLLLQTTELLHWDRYAVRYSTRKRVFFKPSVIADDREPHLLWRKYAINYECICIYLQLRVWC